MLARLAGLAVLCAALGHVQGHTFHLGDCPNVEPMQDFDIDKFLGKWYVIQKTSTASHCLVNNYSKDDEHPGQFKIEQVSEHFLLGLTSLDHKYHYTGTLSIPSDRTPGKMKVKFPLNVAGGAVYTVFMTDYNTYAGIFTCQKLAFAHRQSATIISRNATLDKPYVDKIRTRLSTYGIDPFDLSIIRQTECKKSGEDTTNIDINPGTFTAESVAGAVRKAGGKIGDGIESVADSAKGVYKKVRGDHGDSKEDLAERDMKLDAEWLP